MYWSKEKKMILILRDNPLSELPSRKHNGFRSSNYGYLSWQIVAKAKFQRVLRYIAREAEKILPT